MSLILDGTAGATSPAGIAVGNATVQTGGIAFPATQVAVTDVNTLDDYEEGTWTPIDSSGAGLGFVVVAGLYTKIGNVVFITGRITYPVTASAAAIIIGGLPFTANATDGPTGSFALRYTTIATFATLPVLASTTTFGMYKLGGAQYTNIEMSGLRIDFTGHYPI